MTFEPSSNQRELASFQKLGPTGESLSLRLAAAPSGPVSRTVLTVRSDDEPLLSVGVQLDTSAGEVQLQALGPDLDYACWLGGPITPLIEGNIGGTSFSGSLESDAQDLAARLQPLDTYLPDRVRALLEFFRADLEAALQQMPTPELDIGRQIEIDDLDGPGAWTLGPTLWQHWRRIRTQCAGLAGAANGLFCFGGGAIGLLGANPVTVLIGGAIGCVVGGYVCGSAAQICTDFADEHRQGGH